MKQSLKNRQSAFSLVELMISITILAVLMGVALPSFQNMLLNTQIRNAAGTVLEGIQRARAEAVKQNRYIEFVLLGNDANCDNPATPVSETCASWRVQWVGGGGGNNALLPTTDINNPIVAMMSNEGSHDVKRTTVPAGSNTITFDSTGSRVSPNDAGALGGPTPITSIAFDSTILNPADSHDLQIVISVGGAARICDPNVSTGPYKC